MRILLTGATGYVGGRLLAVLEARGHEVRCLARHQRLGRLVAGGKALARSVLRTQYSTGFMKALRTVATPRRHGNVLQHMLGYLKDTLDQGDRDELLTLIHLRGRAGAARRAADIARSPHPAQ